MAIAAGSDERYYERNSGGSAEMLDEKLRYFPPEGTRAAAVGGGAGFSSCFSADRKATRE